ncbi:SDR family NAD(P)-dependent oxidoreductase [Dyadobacter sp. LJ53]|uniref:SDR family NAD(P)-dependent oxidoreductase n=1 Tax=Dyadobacter chenwenxiniae TaxID=2906456 RepID=UPI001F199BE8|nr:SDR family NAD(P)-dependent oxidoreductase [Dyadobacter chenwenxiniae]MCF0049310.1 SDR family NAD(P)-dependent oxidoreductase [Dyadobacter chenwenxiniae]
MKTFLSIGTGPGIGLATAKRFAHEGFHVIISGRNKEKQEAMREELAKDGFSVEAIILDASNLEAVRSTILEMSTQHEGVDVLHYNAAAMHQASIGSQNMDTFLPDLATNVGGALVAIQTLEPIMTKQGAGSILLTGGLFATDPNPEYLSLSIGKAAIRNLAYGLFKPFKQKNIHVATVTVAAFVEANSAASKNIADAFWGLHTSDPKEWEAEITYSEN